MAHAYVNAEQNELFAYGFDFSDMLEGETIVSHVMYATSSGLVDVTADLITSSAINPAATGIYAFFSSNDGNDDAPLNGETYEILYLAVTASRVYLKTLILRYVRGFQRYF